MFVGIPKEKKHVNALDDLRWLGLAPVLQKWFMRSVRPGLRCRLQTSLVHTYGFKPGKSCADMLGLIRQTIHLSHVWGLELYIASQDVKTAFDAMDHDFLLTAMLRRGAGPGYTALLARELTNIEGIMRIDGANPSLPFDFQRGGKQGGIETPDCFNVYLEEALEKVIAAWVYRGWGFQLDGFVVTHAIWADNIILFCRDRCQLETMIKELGAAITEAKLQWKDSSLKILACGNAVGRLPVVSSKIGSTEYRYEAVTLLNILGDLFHGQGGSMVSVDHRQQRADALYYKHRPLLRSRGPLGPRLMAWYSSPATSCIYASEAWHLTSQILHQLRTWEFKRLRDMLQLRRREGEGN